MKNKKRIAAATAMLLVSALTLSTATYAWFSMNNKVTATGMQVHTRVSSNLLIAIGNEGSGTVGESKFQNDVAYTPVNDAHLEPVSTIDGETFYYTSTKNAKADGDAIENIYVAYDPDDLDAFNENYDFGDSEDPNTGETVKSVGYVDYVFEIKAVNTSETAQVINLTGLKLSYEDGQAPTPSTDNEKAYRIAAFSQTGTVANGVVSAYGDASLVTILAPTGAINQTEGSAIKAEGDEDALDADVLGEVSKAGEKMSLAVAANTTAYYKVTLRLYLEGEDTTCTTSTFMALNEDTWNLDAEWTLDADNTSAVNVITMATAP